jgi:hypothetical protein
MVNRLVCGLGQVVSMMCYGTDSAVGALSDTAAVLPVLGSADNGCRSRLSITASMEH